jgi:hypothetical protein
MKRNIAGVDCSASIVHNCVQNSCDALPIEAETLAKKIYKYFTATLRVTGLQYFCDEAGCWVQNCSAARQHTFSVVTSGCRKTYRNA